MNQEVTLLASEELRIKEPGWIRIFQENETPLIFDFFAYAYTMRYEVKVSGGNMGEYYLAIPSAPFVVFDAVVSWRKEFSFPLSSFQ